MIKKRNLNLPTEQRRVVEKLYEGRWCHDSNADTLRAARRAIGMLVACGWQARSRLDPRASVSPQQLNALYNLREKLPSRWRSAIRKHWARPGSRTLVSLVVNGDDAEILRRMDRTHGPRWLASFWFIWE